MQIPISAQQQEAIDALSAATGKIRSLSGPAGSGKTTVIRALFGDPETTAVVAFTNAAVKVLRNKGLAAASTIHSLFYVPEERTSASGRKYVAFVAAIDYRKERGKLPPAKIDYIHHIVVDEASMVGSKTLSDLERMCDILTLVGDGNQLPPVRDLLYPRGRFNELLHTFELTEVHRQAAGNPALELATRLREGQVDPLAGDLLDTFKSPSVSVRDLMGSLDAEGKSWRVITFTNRRRHALNAAVRSMYGYAGLLEPQPGEILIALDSWSAEIVNGTFLEVVSAEFPSALEATRECLYAKLQVRVIDGGPTIHAVQISMSKYLDGFPEHQPIQSALRNLEGALATEDVALAVNFGYAVTCHKAQGSEFDHIFLVDERFAVYAVADKEAKANPGPDALTGLEAARRWLYTALTRTRSGLTMIPLKGRRK